ncbi:bacteriohopanetetrol glucosamine biosynthesis glycosyltransferase HpnI [Starkeya sp. ORNL1]|uniref:bacteriohopanetetrol glucosamine biosynthesis glycosyltransferase HpnI n=1 Tax=Starkeya sp. ORNL1 TaxID=2709380 RepID=UPI001FEEDF14|nr:bacteriohopanetetrol glucosamine biosynthesis glycosyltransferase HpnI [Starkeya sp. ORNL1]
MVVASLPLLLSLIGSALLSWAAWLIRRRAAAVDPHGARDVPTVSLLKPLHGAEPLLADNLATAVAQNYPGRIEMLCGVARADDPAVAAVESLRASFPAAELRLIVNSRRWGANAKVSNLINIMAEARHDVLVLADSDMVVPPDYVARLVGVLDQPGTGAVSCLYVGRGDAGYWSRLVAAGIDTHFVPATMIALATGLGKPSMGSTIALRRDTLAEIGGFIRFADTLADDYALGEAVRATGRTVVVPAMVLTHACAETSLTHVVRQELRWNATILGIDPAGYTGSIILHPLPLALIGWAAGGGMLAAGATVLALAARASVALATARLDVAGRPAGYRFAPILLIPMRDLLSFAMFVVAFVARSVDWRGAGIKLGRKGRISGPEDI